jgi:hypothetical protein
MEKFAVNTFDVDPQELRAQVPSFAKTIVTTVNSPKRK